MVYWIMNWVCNGVVIARLHFADMKKGTLQLCCQAHVFDVYSLYILSYICTENV